MIQAFRIADLALGDEVLVSEELRSACSSDPTLRFSETREVELKGISGLQKIVALDWK